MRRSEKIAELESQLKAEKDRYLRLAAEYDNFRKRSAKEREGLYQRCEKLTPYVKCFCRSTTIWPEPLPTGDGGRRPLKRASR